MKRIKKRWKRVLALGLAMALLLNNAWIIQATEGDQGPEVQQSESDEPIVPPESVSEETEPEETELPQDTKVETEEDTTAEEEQKKEAIEDETETEADEVKVMAASDSVAFSASGKFNEEDFDLVETIAEPTTAFGDIKTAIGNSMVGTGTAGTGKKLIRIDASKVSEIVFDSSISLNPMNTAILAIEAYNGSVTFKASSNYFFTITTSLNVNAIYFNNINFDMSSGSSQGLVSVGTMNYTAATGATAASLEINGYGTTTISSENAAINASMFNINGLNASISSAELILKNIVVKDIGGNGKVSTSMVPVIKGLSLTMDGMSFENITITNVAGGIIRAMSTDSDGSALKISNSKFINISNDNEGCVIRWLKSGTSIQINDSIFYDNEVTNSSGGVMSVSGDAVEITDSKFEGNSATSNGGAIFQQGGALTITNSDFIDNYAGTEEITGNGGAIYQTGSPLTIENTNLDKQMYITGNIATGNGGAIYSGADTEIKGNIYFENNYSKTNGGAVYATQGNTIIEGATFEGNKSDSNGGAIYTGTIALTDTNLFKNTADGDGGAVYATGSFSLDNVSVYKNSAENGAGVYSGGSTWVGSTIKDSHIYDNSANANGGGFYVLGGGGDYCPLSITNSVIGGEDKNYANKAVNGAGIYYEENSYGNVKLSLHMDQDSSIEYNQATGHGGGVYLVDNGTGIIDVAGGFFENNSAEKGGGLYVESTYNDNTHKITGVTFHQNQAKENGGALYVEGSGGTLTISDNTGIGEFVGNTSIKDGGAMYSDAGMAVKIANIPFKNNETSENGGAIGLPVENGVAQVKNTIYTDKVLFEDNKAQNYISFLAPAGKAIHTAQILNTQSYSKNSYGIDFSHAFNNYDILYVGDPVAITYYENTGKKPGDDPDGIVNIDYAEIDAEIPLTIYSDEQLPGWETYNFLGWNEDKDAGEAEYINDETKTQYVSDEIKNDIDLFGIWEPKPNIAVSKEADEVVFSGNVIAYTITVENQSVAGTNVPPESWNGTITDTLPEQYTDKDAVVSLEIKNSQDGNITAYELAVINKRVVLTIPDVILTGGDKITITYLLTAPELSADQEYIELVNTAKAFDPYNEDADGYSDSTDNTVYVVPKSGDLELVKSLMTPTTPVNANNDVVVKVGDRLTYQIEAKNTGAADTVLYQVQISDILEDGLQFEGNVKVGDQMIPKGTDVGSYQFDEDTSTFTYTHDKALHGTTSFYLRFDATVTKEAGGTIENTASGTATVPVKPTVPGVTPADEDQKTSDPVNDNDTSAYAAPKISIEKEAPEETVFGGYVDYTITVENGASAGLWKGSVEDSLANEVTYTEGSVSVSFIDSQSGMAVQNSSYDESSSGYNKTNHELIFKDIRLYGGHSMIIKFRVQVTEGANEIKNTAVAHTEDGDTESGTTTTVVNYNPAELAVAKTVTKAESPYDSLTRAEFAAGDKVRYVITAGNSSDDTLAGLLDVVITDKAPDDIVFDPDTLSVTDIYGNDVLLKSNTTTASEINIALEYALCYGQEVTITIEAEVVSASRKYIVNTAVVDCNTPDAEQSLTYVPVRGEASQTNKNKDYKSDVSIEISATPWVFSGEMIAYQFEITNESANAEFNGTAAIVLPEGLTITQQEAAKLNLSTTNVSYTGLSWNQEYTVLTIEGLHMEVGGKLSSTSFNVKSAHLSGADSGIHTINGEVVEADGVSKEEDHADTIVYPKPGTLLITKYVTTADVDYETFISDPDTWSLDGQAIKNGTKIKYWLIVENSGAKDTVLADVEIGDSLDPSLLYENGSEQVDGKSSFLGTGTYTWNNNSRSIHYVHNKKLAGGEGFVVSFAATVEKVDGASKISNTAAATAKIPGERDPDPTEDTKTGGSNDTDLGHQVTYKIQGSGTGSIGRVQNGGQETAVANGHEEVVRDGTTITASIKLDEDSYLKGWYIDGIYYPATENDSRLRYEVGSIRKDTVITAVLEKEPTIAMKVIKKEYGTEKTLSDVLFRLMQKDTETGAYDINAGEYKTNAEGQFTIDDLTEGSYRGVEVAPPAGYTYPIGNSNYISIEVTGTRETSTGEKKLTLSFPSLKSYDPVHGWVSEYAVEYLAASGDDPARITVNNSPLSGIYANLTLHKMDENSTALPGAQFSLYINQGTTGDDWQIMGAYQDTDTEGNIAWNGLGAGVYKLVETAAAPGYQKLAEEKAVLFTLVPGSGSNSGTLYLAETERELNLADEISLRVSVNSEGIRVIHFDAVNEKAPEPVLKKEVDKTFVNIGENLAYTIQAQNKADRAVWHDVVLTDELQDGLEYQSAAVYDSAGKLMSNAVITHKDGIVTISVGDLQPQDSVSVVLVVKVTKEGVYSNEVYAAGTDDNGNTHTPDPGTSGETDTGIVIKYEVEGSGNGSVSRSRGEEEEAEEIITNGQTDHRENIEKGTDITVSAAPDEDSYLKGWYIDGVYYPVTDDEDLTCILENITEDTVITAVIDARPVTAVEIIKVDAGGTSLLEGAVFRIRKQSAGSDEYDLVIGDYTSDESGHVLIDGLSEGKYRGFEITPPSGYTYPVGNSNAIGMDITSTRDQETGEKVLAIAFPTLKDYDEENGIIPGQMIAYTAADEENNVVLTVRNQKVTDASAHIQVQKVDVKGEALQGAQFTLYRLDEEAIWQPVGGDYHESDTDGNLSWNNLTIGDYKLVETAAPDGYQLLSEEKAVTFTLAGEADRNSGTLFLEHSSVLPDEITVKENMSADGVRAYQFIVENSNAPVPSLEKVVSTQAVQVGDELLYTITAKNNAVYTKYAAWKDVVIEDKLQEGLLYQDVIVYDGDGIKKEAEITYTDRLLRISVGDLEAGETVQVELSVLVMAEGIYQNTANASGRDDNGNSTDPKEADSDKTTAEDPNGDNELISEPPVIDPIKEGDRIITGTGIPDSDITVTFPDGSTSKTKVDKDGNWSVPVPDDLYLTEDDTITATQTEPGKRESVETEEVPVPDGVIIPDPAAPGKLAGYKTIYSSDGLQNLEGKTLQVGDEVQYRIYASNTEEDKRSTVLDVSISDSLPECLEYIEGTLAVTGTQETLSYRVIMETADILHIQLDEPLGGGQEICMSFQVRVTGTGTNGSITNTAVVSGTVPSEEDPDNPAELKVDAVCSNAVIKKGDTPPPLVTPDDEIPDGETPDDETPGDGTRYTRKKGSTGTITRKSGKAGTATDDNSTIGLFIFGLAVAAAVLTMLGVHMRLQRRRYANRTKK